VHAFHQHRRSLQTESGANPLHQQALVLGPDGPLGSMRPNRDESQQSIQIKSGQRADMRSQTEVALREQRIRKPWQAQGHDGHE
jgi:hypothetical protein